MSPPPARPPGTNSLFVEESLTTSTEELPVSRNIYPSRHRERDSRDVQPYMASAWTPIATGPGTRQFPERYWHSSMLSDEVDGSGRPLPRSPFHHQNVNDRRRQAGSRRRRRNRTTAEQRRRTDSQVNPELRQQFEEFMERSFAYFQATRSQHH